MKAIILVLSAKECMNLLNGDLSILVRKKFPKDYVGWVYVYVTKAHDFKDEIYLEDFVEKPIDNRFGKSLLNGKVVVRFWCNNVEEVKFNMDYVFGGLYNIKSYSNEKCFERDCCLNQEELDNYLNKNNNKRDNVGTAIHITRVQPFDKPKEIKEFDSYCKGGMKCLYCRHYWTDDSAGYSIPMCSKMVKRAPSTYCYIEI